MDEKIIDYILSGVSVVVFVVISFIFLWRWYKSHIIVAPRNYICKMCECQDLSYIAELYSRFFERDFSKLADMQRLYKFDKRIFWKIVRRTSKSESVPMGCIVIYRINKAGREAIRRGTFRGASPQLDHLAKAGKVTALYIAALAGQTRGARAAAISAISAHVATLSPQHLYARPITKDGARLAKQYGFHGDVPLFVEHCEADAAEVDVTRRWLDEQERRGLSFSSDVLPERHGALEVACEPSVDGSLLLLPA